VRDGGGGVGGGCFKDCISKKVRNGRDTLFLTDPWLGGMPLAVRFRRLYDLCAHKFCTVGEMSSLGWEEGEWRGSGGSSCGSGRRSC